MGFKVNPHFIGGLNVKDFKHCQQLILHVSQTNACQHAQGAPPFPTDKCFNIAVKDPSCQQLKSLFSAPGTPPAVEVVGIYDRIVVVKDMALGDGVIGYSIINREGYILNIASIGALLKSPIRNNKMHNQGLRNQRFRDYYGNDISSMPEYKKNKYNQVFTTFLNYTRCHACKTVYHGIIRIVFDSSGKLMKVQIAKKNKNNKVQDRQFYTIFPAANK